MQQLEEYLKGKTYEELRAILLGEVTDFPEGYVLFIQRDMFGDSCFPHVLVPSTKEAFLSFFVHHHWLIHKQNTYELRVTQYGFCHMVQVYYDQADDHWVKGFLRYGVPEGMEVPFSQKITEDDNMLFDGWGMTTLRKRDPESRTEGDWLLWSKN